MKRKPLPPSLSISLSESSVLPIVYGRVVCVRRGVCVPGSQKRTSRRLTVEEYSRLSPFLLLFFTSGIVFLRDNTVSIYFPSLVSARLRVGCAS